LLYAYCMRRLNTVRTDSDAIDASTEPQGWTLTAGVDPGRHLVGEWRRLNSVRGQIANAASTALASLELSLVEFTVLDILQEQINGHMRMQDVAVVAGLTTSATTRLVNRLEERSLLRRILCDYDRRGIYTELTDQGLELITRARPVHDAAVREHFTTDDTARLLTGIAAAMTAR
jgi:DNA-binding MarR family transcriptional regulator